MTAIIAMKSSHDQNTGHSGLFAKTSPRPDAINHGKSGFLPHETLPGLDTQVQLLNGNRLRKVARLVDIGAFKYCHVI